MKVGRGIALAAFVVALLVGTLTDLPRATGPKSPSVLAADFHVHAAPGDGLLPVWEVQREAERRGLDAVAITNHNHALSSRIARVLGLIRDYPIVIHSQELTTPNFHIAAVGASAWIDWRLPVIEAIAAIHATGGAAIASHPDQDSWRVGGPEAALALDGAEVAHPGMLIDAATDADIRGFFEKTLRINPSLAAIGSSDFHFLAPLGMCRTYALVDGVSQEALLTAVRRGRTVAVCPGGRITGKPEDVTQAADYLGTEPPARFGYGLSTWIAMTALTALAAAVLRR